MIELRVTQNSVGNFNWANQNEKSFVFQMGIFKDGQLIEENGIKALIRFSGDPDEAYTFEDPFDNLTEVFELCCKESGKWISSTDYLSQCLLFAKVYSENYEELNATLLQKHKERTEKKIAELQKSLAKSEIIPEDIWYMANSYIETEVSKYEKWILSNQKDLEQLKEDSPKHKELMERIEGYKSKIESLRSKELPIPENN
jgi:hypothetical protein